MLSAIILSLGLFFGCHPDPVTAGSIEMDPEEEVDPITWQECGYEIGDHACDFSFINQHGEYVALYDSVGRPILIDMSTMWCWFCNIAAFDLTDIKEEYKNIDLDVITLLFENGDREQPSIEDLSYWANEHRSEDNILSGDVEILAVDPKDGWPIEGWPTFFIVDEGMVIRGSLIGFHPEILRDTIDESLELLREPHGDIE